MGASHARRGVGHLVSPWPALRDRLPRREAGTLDLGRADRRGLGAAVRQVRLDLADRALSLAIRSARRLRMPCRDRSALPSAPTMPAWTTRFRIRSSRLPDEAKGRRCSVGRHAGAEDGRPAGRASCALGPAELHVSPTARQEGGGRPRRPRFRAREDECLRCGPPCSEPGRIGDEPSCPGRDRTEAPPHPRRSRGSLRPRIGACSERRGRDFLPDACGPHPHVQLHTRARPGRTRGPCAAPTRWGWQGARAAPLRGRRARGGGGARPPRRRTSRWRPLTTPAARQAVGAVR